MCIGICYVTVSTYDTTITSLIINYCDTSAFCHHGMDDTTYVTTIVASLSIHKTIGQVDRTYRTLLTSDASTKPHQAVASNGQWGQSTALFLEHLHQMCEIGCTYQKRAICRVQRTRSIKRVKNPHGRKASPHVCQSGACCNIYRAACLAR